MAATRCINALNAAAGRELTPEELQSVFDKINKTARDLAAGRQEFADAPHNMASPEGIIRAAAEMEAKTLVAEKQRAVANAYRQVQTLAEPRGNDADHAGIPALVRQQDDMTRLPFGLELALRLF